MSLIVSNAVARSSLLSRTFTRSPHTNVVSKALLRTLAKHPNRIYLHPVVVENKQLLALSLLKNLPLNPSKNAVIIGWLSPGTHPVTAVEETKESPVEFKVNPSNFTENIEFERVLQEVLRRECHNDPEVKALAKVQRIGYLNIPDSRVGIVPWGRQPEPEDIFGMVALDGKGDIVPNSYQPNSTHRLVTASSGLAAFSSYLVHKLREHLSSNTSST